MRALVLLALAACQSEPKQEQKPVPADRSIELRGAALETFCKDQERMPGWTCDDFANCETVTEGTAQGTPSTICRAKLGS